MSTLGQTRQETSSTASPELEQLCINTIRTLAMDAVQKANSGHPGTPMALAPLAFVLWDRFLRHNPKNPDWANRDRFVLSNGHASMLLYSLLFLTGYERPTLDDIKNFRQLHSPTAGHPEREILKGVETTTGPLGQGVAASVGIAIARRWLAARYNAESSTIINYRTYVFCSDGDLMEGISHEAASLAGHLGLAELIWFYDDNHITIEGDTELAFSEDTETRFKGYGWNVLHITDANDLDLIGGTIREAQKETQRPTFIRVRSHIGWGSPKQDTAAAHGEPLGEDAIRKTKENYGWPADQHFLVPDEARDYMRRATERGAKFEADWNAGLKKWRSQVRGELATEWDTLQAGKLPAGWDADIPVFAADAKGMATREAGGKVLNAIAPKIPWLIGGSADLAPSTKTLINKAPSLESKTPGGRNMHFGIREHGMGGAMNGMAVSKLRPYGATFLVFSDYMRGSIRIAALMKVPVIYVFTHDSIGLGEDGPTHQPIETLMALRAMPRLYTMRPGDANETAEVWRMALELNAPVALALSRQAMPTLDRQKYNAASGVRKGAYVVAESKGGPEIILIATGSELQFCIGAHEQLTQQGISCRVVSMPCFELFQEQSKEYREQVLPPNVKKRLSVEAGTVFGWREIVGDGGRSIGMHDFGASAPWKDVYREFGFTVENVVKVAREMLSKP